jgi:hypothetical protein
VNDNFNGAPDGYTDGDLIAAWLDANRSMDEDISSWASGELNYDLVYEQPDRAWSIILELIRLAPDDTVLAIIAAGPLENLLCAHGPDFIERVETQASTNPRFRHCLAGVWGSNRMPPEVYTRMRTAVGDEQL